jgi:hypothetical protein
MLQDRVGHWAVIEVCQAPVGVPCVRINGKHKVGSLKQKNHSAKVT